MFIRTKDAIYEANENGETYNGYGCKSKNGTIKIHKKDIIKQSKTIEDLCDFYYIETDDLETDGLFSPSEFDDFICDMILWELDDVKVKAAYGVIKTRKGLKYVARFYEDGKVELLDE